LEKVLSLIVGSPWWLIVGLAVYGVSLRFYGDLWQKKNASHDRWVRHLRRNYWARVYQFRIRRVLNRIDRRLHPGIEPKGWPSRAVQTAWSGPLLNLCLGLAVAYPIMLLLLQWAVTGEPGRIGTLEVISGGQHWALRTATIGGLAVAGASWIQNARSASVTWTLRVITVVLTGGAVAVAAFATSMAALAIGAACLAAFATITPPASVVVATGAAVAAAAGPAAGAGILATAGAAAVATDVAGRRMGRPAAALVVLAGLLLSAVAATAMLVQPTPDRLGDAASLLIFLGVLPLLNALADFASIGLTRFLVRAGLEARGWRRFAWLLDALGGVAILVALGFAIIAFATFVRFPDGTPLMDAGATLADIRETPGYYWWLYLGLASTLLPTLAHLSVGSFGFVLMLWPWLRTHIADGLEAGAAGDQVLGRWAVQWLCLSMTLTVVVPLVLIGHVVANHGAIGLWFLDLFQSFAIRIAPPGSAP